MIGEKLYHKKMKNGLNVYVLHKKGYNKKYAVFATHYGSIDNKFVVPGEIEPLEVPEGIAHFLEHKLFEEEFGNIFDKFADLGASANAYTNYTYTAYLFSCTSRFEENLNLLLDFVQRPYFTKENVEKEKGIIEQELRMYQDDPHWSVLHNLLQSLYRLHPIRIDIGGTVDSIQKIDVETLYKCYETFYHPENMVLFVVGDFDVAGVFELVEKNISKREYKPRGKILRIYPEEPKEINQRKITKKMSVSRPLINIGFKDNNNGYRGRDLFKKIVTSEILLCMLFGKSSDLFWELYNDDLIDDNFDFDYEGNVDYGFAIIGTPTRDPDKLHEKLLEGIEHYGKRGLKKDDYTRTKNKVTGNYIKGFNSLEFISTLFVGNYFKQINVLDFIEILGEITFEDVEKRFYELLNPDYHSYSVIEPISANS